MTIVGEFVSTFNFFYFYKLTGIMQAMLDSRRDTKIINDGLSLLKLLGTIIIIPYSF